MSIDKVLGKITEYPQTYDPSILVKELRQNNRDTVDLDSGNLPFLGFDVWNAYEVSALTDDGLPVAGVAKIIYPCDSLYIVESKSIKLYLNSFNMDRCGHDPYFVRQHIQKTVSRDLSDLLQTDVQVAIFPSYTPINGRPVFLTSNKVEDNKWLSLEDVVTLNNVNVYKETPELLKTVSADESEVHKFHSALLKSNCKVTSQPDWGDIYITITGDKIPDQESLLRYIISFRDECHFHEEICETVYKRLHDIYSPRHLAVTCLYARRGGIDINPTRYSFSNLAPQALIDITTLHTKTIKQ